MKFSLNFCFKRNVNIRKEQDKYILENNSNKKGFVIFAKPIYSKNKQYKLISDIDIIYGNGCEVKILNKKFKVVKNIEHNSINFFDDINKLTFIAIVIQPKTKIVINSLEVNFNYDKNKEIFEKFNNDILLICPGYPNINNKYNYAFIHSRLQAYKQENLGIDLAVVDKNFINFSSFTSFEGIQVVSTGYNEIRLLLQNKKYKKILIHFFDEKYAQILDASNISDTEIILYSHGSDTLYKAWDKLNAKYFERKTKIPDDIKELFPIKDELIKRYNQKENVKFVFVSQWALEMSERLIGIKYNNAHVIPCNIDEKTFIYEKKNPELRKKIFVLRKFDNLSTYSIDIVVKIILELSNRKIFKDLEFNIYGDGNYHDILLKPITKFSNVNIYKGFLSHEQIAKVHKENGIALFPSRFDTQAVSACEAAMSGNVVITSYGIGTEEYINPNLGTYCETEKIIQYANLIEEIYNDEKRFVNLSEKMHKSVISTCSYENTVKNDLKLITSDLSMKKRKYKKQNSKPLLTIVVPSYNVEKFLENNIYTLINNDFSNRLEILIINDGSKDNTAEIGRKLEKLTTVDGCSVVKLIDKKNGGHGSTINKGIELARGKYFRLMDGDDYFIEEEFVKFIQILEKEDSDIILTNYIADYAIDAVKVPVRHYEFMIPGEQYKLDNMCEQGYGFDNWGPLLSTSTYKTSVLKNSNFKIDEHCFYVDMEYNFIGYLNSKTVVYYSFDIYNYYLGRVGQSVSAESYKRNFKQHEIVTIRLIDEFYKIKERISFNKQYYLKNKIILPLIEAQYYILTQTLMSGKEFRKFDKKLKQYSEFYNDLKIARIAIKMHRITNGYFLKTIENLIKFKNILLFKIRRKNED